MGKARVVIRSEIKAVVVGNEAVGKSTLIASIKAGGRFPTNDCMLQCRGGSEKKVKQNIGCPLKNTTIRFNWDQLTVHLREPEAGMEMIRLRPIAYINADIFLVCFSVAYRTSFQAIMAGWYPEIVLSGHLDAKFVLVGLKSDLRSSKKYLGSERPLIKSRPMDFVTMDEAHELARQIGAYAYIECSSLKNRNLTKLVHLAVRAAHDIPLPVEKRGGGFSMSSVVKKISNISIKEDKYNERLVITRAYNCTPNARFGHTAAHVDGQLYVFGGYKNHKNEFADSPIVWGGDAGNKWTTLQNLSDAFSPRVFLCAVVINVIPPPLSSSFNTTSSSSSTSAATNAPSSSSSSTLPYLSRVLLFGGKSNGYHNDIMCFDPVSQDLQQISATGQIPSPRYGMTGISCNNEMIVFGGYDSDSTPCNDCYSFNYEAKQWKKMELKGYKPPPRFFHSAVCADDLNLMIVYGGKDGSNTLDDMFSIDLVTGECKQIMPKSSTTPGPRQCHACAYAGRGVMVLIGGKSKSNVSMDDVLLFSLGTQKWTVTNRTGWTPRVHQHSAVSIKADAEIWTFGGTDGKVESQYAVKLRITKNTPRIYHVLPKSSIVDILHLLPAADLARLSEVSRKFNEIASDQSLWTPHARALDPDYDSQNGVHPKTHYASFLNVWYNDFTKAPIPPAANYIKPYDDEWQYT